MVNHSYTRITNNTNHFIVPLKPIKNRVVTGYGVVIKVRGLDMVKWKIEDYYGKYTP